MEAPDPDPPPDDDPAAVEELRRIMWEGAGVVRHRRGLVAARDEMEAIRRRLSPRVGEGGNMAEVGALVIEAALARTESRGAHWRVDFPEPDPRWGHSLVFG